MVEKKAFSISFCVIKKDEYCNKHTPKILVMKSGVIMQWNLIDYEELTQNARGRSQHNNDKMHVVFAEGIKCKKYCTLI